MPEPRQYECSVSSPPPVQTSRSLLHEMILFMLAKYFFFGKYLFIELENTYSLELYCFAMGSRGREAKVTPKQNCARSCGRLRHIYHRPERGFTFLVSNSSLSAETNFLKHGIVGESYRLIFSNLFVFVIQAKKVAGGLTDSWDFHFHKNIEQ